MNDLNERFLDDLIIEVADLDSLNGKPEHLRSTYFLRFSYGVKQHYIQKALESRLPVNDLPNGRLYVFTPEEGFGYDKSTQESGLPKIEEIPTDFHTDRTLRQIIQGIMDSEKRNVSNHKPTSIGVLFYNNDAKDKFVQEMDGNGFHLMGIKVLNIPGYGIVKCYKYID